MLFPPPTLLGIVLFGRQVILVQSATAFYRGPSCGSPDFVKVNNKHSQEQQYTTTPSL